MCNLLTHFWLGQPPSKKNIKQKQKNMHFLPLLLPSTYLCGYMLEDKKKMSRLDWRKGRGEAREKKKSAQPGIILGG